MPCPCASPESIIRRSETGSQKSKQKHTVILSQPVGHGSRKTLKLKSDPMGGRSQSLIAQEAKLAPPRIPFYVKGLRHIFKIVGNLRPVHLTEACLHRHLWYSNRTDIAALL